MLYIINSMYKFFVHTQANCIYGILLLLYIFTDRKCLRCIWKSCVRYWAHVLKQNPQQATQVLWPMIWLINLEHNNINNIYTSLYLPRSFVSSLTHSRLYHSHHTKAMCKTSNCLANKKAISLHEAKHGKRSNNIEKRSY